MPPPRALIECERLAQEVGLPAIRPGMDALVVLARYRAALVQANKNLKDTSSCVRELEG